MNERGCGKRGSRSELRLAGEEKEVGASPNSAERERVRPARQGGAGHGAGLQVGVGGGDRASERGGACA